MDLLTLSDEEIVKQWQTQPSSKLITELVEGYRKKVIQQCQCQYHIKDAETAKDLSQEVFPRALTKLHSYRQEAPFSAWLGTIARNRCSDHLKQQKHVLHREITLKIAATMEEDLHTDSIVKPTVEILEELMEKIEQNQNENAEASGKIQQRLIRNCLAQFIFRVSTRTKTAVCPSFLYIVPAPPAKRPIRNAVSSQRP